MNLRLRPITMTIPLKPGHTTTEFWTIIVAGLSLTGLSLASILDVTWAAMAIAVLTLAYNGSLTKLTAIQAEAEAADAASKARIAEAVASQLHPK